MIKGVQHPLRGIFLRYYLFQCFRDRQFTLESEAQSEAYLSALMRNVKDASTLWIRLRFQGQSTSEAERQRDWNVVKPFVLVHTVHLCELDVADNDIHRHFVLPFLEFLKTSPGCKKLPETQEVLLETLVEHLTPQRLILAVSEILACTTSLEKAVNIRGALSTLMNRVADFIENERKARMSLRTEVGCSVAAVYGENKAPDQLHNKDDDNDEETDVVKLLQLVREHVQAVLESTAESGEDSGVAWALDLLCCYQVFILRLAPGRNDLLDEVFHALRVLLEGSKESVGCTAVIEMMSNSRLSSLPQLPHFQSCLDQDFLDKVWPDVWGRLLTSWEHEREKFTFSAASLGGFFSCFRPALVCHDTDDDLTEQELLCTELLAILTTRHLDMSQVSVTEVAAALATLCGDEGNLQKDFAFVRCRLRCNTVFYSGRSARSSSPVCAAAATASCVVRAPYLASGACR